MAVNLTIALSDAEQAKLQEAAELVARNATPQQIKTWAEKTAKARLRDEVMTLLRTARLEAENAARRQAETGDTTAWPEAE